MIKHLHLFWLTVE